MPEFKSDAELHESPVVANCRMNRERELTGGNSYTRDLGVSPVEFLKAKLQTQPKVSWLDLCCGSGRALNDAAATCDASDLNVEITGIDLAGVFAPVRSARLSLVETSIEDWHPEARYDLISCVHGLHYVGDKLSAISRAVSWLQAGGAFLAHLDPSNLRHADHQGFGRIVVRHLRDSGLEFDARRHLIRGPSSSNCTISWPWIYVGADDAAGPNCTGQPAVNSWFSTRPSN